MLFSVGCQTWNPAGGTIGLESRVDLGEGGSIKNVNFIAIQINAKLPFEFDVVYRNELDFDDPPLTGAAYSTELEMQEWRFNDRFEKVFGLKEVCSLARFCFSVDFFVADSSGRNKESVEVATRLCTTLQSVNEGQTRSVKVLASGLGAF